MCHQDTSLFLWFVTAGVYMHGPAKDVVSIEGAYQAWPGSGGLAPAGSRSVWRVASGTGNRSSRLDPTEGEGSAGPVPFQGEMFPSASGQAAGS